MAPSVTGNKPKQTGKKRLVQPVLPALPLQPKSRGQTAASPQPTGNKSQALPPGVSGPGPELVNGGAAEEARTDKIQQFPVQSSQAVAGDSASVKSDQPVTSPLPQDLSETPTSGPTSIAIAELATAASSEAATGHQVNNDNAFAQSDQLLSPVDAMKDDASQSSSQPPQYQQKGVLEWADDVAAQDQTSQESSESPLEDVYRNGSSTAPELPDQTPRFAPADLKIVGTASLPSHAAVYTNGNLEDRDSASHQVALSSAEADENLQTQSNTGSLPTIAEHLLQLASTKEWADWVIMVNARGLQPFVCYAHGLVLTRSSRLQALMERQQASNFAGNAINLYPPRAVVPHAFEAALRFLYSDSVLSSDVVFPRNPSTGIRPARAQLLDYLISYWISGIELGLEAVAVRAAKLLGDFIDWDVAEIAVREAGDFVANAWPSSDGKGSVSSYKGLGTTMMRVALRFLATHLSVGSFKLDTNTVSTLLQSRFCLLEDARLKHNPALASMVFGSMPSSASMSPSSPQSEILQAVASFADSTASKILLNLDFSDLEFFCRQWTNAQGEAVTALVGEIVDERESRRLKIVSNRTIPNKQRMTNSASWDAAGFREFASNGSILRERVGFLLPTK